ncbi:hypothetical protein ACFE04_029674 [Oxalis oulophora]
MEEDLFESIPDSILLLILNKIGDVKSLGRCSIVSSRFHSLIPLVQNVVVRVDCVISDDDDDDTSHPSSSSHKFPNPFSNIMRFLFSGFLKPLQASFSLLLGNNNNIINKRINNTNDDDHGQGQGHGGQSGVTHHSPTQVLKNFNEITYLRIELPTAELTTDDGVLLKWRAQFGSTLDYCVILGASSVLRNINNRCCVVANNDDDDGSIPESFYTNGGLKLRVVWTISSLIAASARHYLLQPIIADHKTLDNLVLTDADGQGVLCMNRDQLEELRVKPLLSSSASKRTLVPALNMRLWYAPTLELPGGIVLKGATLVAIRPSEQSSTRKEAPSDGSWVSNAFEEPYGTAAKMLVKRRTYCLEMNSF